METFVIPNNWETITASLLALATYSAWVWNKGREYGVKSSKAAHRAAEAKREARIAKQQDAEQALVYVVCTVKIHFQGGQPAAVELFPNVQATCADAELLASRRLPKLEAQVLADPEVSAYLSSLERSMSLCEDVLRIGGYIIRPENITNVTTSYWYRHQAPNTDAADAGSEEVNPYE